MNFFIYITLLIIKTIRLHIIKPIRLIIPAIGRNLGLLQAYKPKMTIAKNIKQSITTGDEITSIKASPKLS
jgi:hypothetical protein